MAERIKRNAEKRAQESSAPGSDKDVDYVDLIKEIATVTIWGSDSEF